MNLRVITAPATEPVSLETAKLFLRVDGTAEDALITSLIKAAREKGEDLSRRAFISQTLEMVIEEWPECWSQPLARPPLISVTSIKYHDVNNVEYTFSDYYVNERVEPGEIVFHSKPSTSLLTGEGAIVIRYVAGYGADATSVPERIKNTILALVAYRYENRESNDVPSDIRKAFVAERASWF